MEEATRNSKRVVSNTIFLYTRMIVTTIVALFTVRVVLSTLGVTDYGIYNAVGGLILSMTFISKVLSLASQRFLSISLGRNDYDDLRHNLSALVIVYIMLSLLIVLLSETVGLWFLNTRMTIPEERMVAANVTFHLSLASFVFTILVSPFQALIISCERMKLFAYISILEVILKLVIVVFLLVNLGQDNLILYAILMLIATFLSNVVYYLYCKRKMPQFMEKLTWDKERLKNILGYSSWTMFGTLSGVCSNQGISILLNLFWGPVANTAFAISTQVSNHANMLAQNFFVAVRPSLTKSYAREDVADTTSLFYISSKMIFVLLFVVLLPVYVATNELLELWLGEVQPFMTDFVRQMLILSLILALSNPITTIVQAAGAVKKYHILVDGFALLSLPLAFAVVKFGGQAVTVLYVFNLVFLIAHFIRIVILKSVTPYFSTRHYINHFVLPMLAVTAVSFAIVFALKSVVGNGFLPLVTVVGVAMATSLLLSYLLLLNSTERTHIKNLIKKRIP